MVLKLVCRGVFNTYIYARNLLRRLPAYKKCCIVYIGMIWCDVVLANKHEKAQRAARDSIPPITNGGRERS